MKNGLLQDWPRQLICSFETSGMLSENVQLPWFRRLKAAHRNEGLVETLDKLADSSLKASGAIVPEGTPRVYLTRLASWLNVRINFAQDTSKQPYQPSLEGNSAVNGGLLFREGQEWVIRAGARHQLETRVQVAHELGHVLLYSDDDGIDIRTWRRSRATQFEETVCNYLGRRLLIPSTLFPPNNQLHSVAKFLTTEVVEPYKTTHRVAALRLLDERISEQHSIRAFILWRQYHPFDDMFAITWARQCGVSEGSVRDLARTLRQIAPNSSFSEAIHIWYELTGCSHGQLEFSRQLLDQLRELQSEHDTLRRIADKGISKFAEGNFSVTFRPQWVLWRSENDHKYIPCLRGSAREGSLVQRIGALCPAVSEVATEEVRIGQLKGIFVSDAFAHGNATNGARFILHVLRDNE